MTNSPSPRRRLFTPDEANATLPLVRAIASDLVSVAREVGQRREGLAQLRAARDPNRRDMYSEELAHAEEQLQRDAARFQEYLEELESLGVKVGDPADGLIEFPGLLEGRPVFWRWRLGEPAVEACPDAPHEACPPSPPRQGPEYGSGARADRN